MTKLLSCAVLFAVATLSPATAQPSAYPPASADAEVIRQSSIDGLDPAIARGELLRLGTAATVSDLVDLVAPFVPTYGQATDMIPVNFGGTGMTSVLYKFGDGRAIVAMIHAAEPTHLAGPYACRMFMDPNRGKPDSALFAKLVHWCSNMITLGNVDPNSVAPPQP